MKKIWEQSGSNQCDICKKGFAQITGDVKDGKFVYACRKCLYDKV